MTGEQALQCFELAILRERDRMRRSVPRDESAIQMLDNIAGHLREFQLATACANETAISEAARSGAHQDHIISRLDMKIDVGKELEYVTNRLKDVIFLAENTKPVNGDWERYARELRGIIVTQTKNAMKALSLVNITTW